MEIPLYHFIGLFFSLVVKLHDIYGTISANGENLSLLSVIDRNVITEVDPDHIE